MVSSAGSLARGSKWKLPSCQRQGADDHLLAVAAGLTAWKRWPNRKNSEQLSGAVLQGERPGGPLRLHGLQERGEVGLLQRTLGLHLRWLL